MTDYLLEEYKPRRGVSLPTGFSEGSQSVFNVMLEEKHGQFQTVRSTSAIWVRIQHPPFTSFDSTTSQPLKGTHFVKKNDDLLQKQKNIHAPTNDEKTRLYRYPAVWRKEQVWCTNKQTNK